MNMSDLISDLKMDTGLAFISLPLENLDERIKDVIQKRTLKTFNQYFPQRTSETIDLNNLLCIQNNYAHSIYEIPLINGRKVIGIEDVKQDNMSSNGGLWDPVADFTVGTYADMMLAQTQADLVSLISPAFTFHFEHPNLLHLYNIGTVGFRLILEVLLAHPGNLSTIPETMQESFYELALLDFKRFCYNSLKHFNEIQTANGTINLRIDEWSNAEADRKDLLRDWDAKFHLDRKCVYYI